MDLLLQLEATHRLAPLRRAPVSRGDERQWAPCAVSRAIFCADAIGAGGPAGEEGSGTSWCGGVGCWE